MFKVRWKLRMFFLRDQHNKIMIKVNWTDRFIKNAKQDRQNISVKQHPKFMIKRACHMGQGP